MKRLNSLVTLSCIAVALMTAPEAHAQSAYVLRDTTSLPPPAAGHARLVVARETKLQGSLKPEFVFLDDQPFETLPPRSAVTGEITPGWHRLWLGRGATAVVWFEVTAGERYLFRLREQVIESTWRADLVRDARDGYAGFAKREGMQLAVTTPSGLETMRRNLIKLNADTTADSTARVGAQGMAQLPIEIAEAWYVDLTNPSQAPSEYEIHPGKLTVNADSIRYTRADTTTVAIPRSSITLVRYGGMKGNRTHPWLNVFYKMDGIALGAAFVDAASGKGNASYNRLFGELEKTIPGH